MKHYQAPNIIKLTKRWVDNLDTIQGSLDGRQWYPARPMGFDSLGQRLKASWLVFTGQADALLWPPFDVFPSTPPLNINPTKDGESE